MMDDTVRWIIAIAVTVNMGFTGMLITAFYRIGDRIAKGNADLHERVNRVSLDYVRRDDLSIHLARVDDMFKSMKSDMKEQNADTRREIKEQHRELQSRFDTMFALTTPAAHQLVHKEARS